MKRKAIIVLDADDIHVYFLVINMETGEEIHRCSTKNFGTFRCDDLYREADIIQLLVNRFNLEVVNKIYWGL